MLHSFDYSLVYSSAILAHVISLISSYHDVSFRVSRHDTPARSGIFAKTVKCHSNHYFLSLLRNIPKLTNYFSRLAISYEIPARTLVCFYKRFYNGVIACTCYAIWILCNILHVFSTRHILVVTHTHTHIHIP